MKVVSMPHPVEDDETIIQVTMSLDDWTAIVDWVDIVEHYYLVGELVRKLKKAGVPTL